MKFKENEVVTLIKDCVPGVRIGDEGVVIMAFDRPLEAYEVEFLNDDGSQKAQCTLSPWEIGPKEQ